MSVLITEAKFQRNSRILKKYTAIYEKRPPTHVGSRFLPRNLFCFYKKSNKFRGSVSRFRLEIAYCLLLNRRKDAVSYAAHSETEEIFVEPLLSEDG